MAYCTFIEGVCSIFHIVDIIAYTPCCWRSLGLVVVEVDDPGESPPFRSTVRRLTPVINQTRPDIATAARIVARNPHDLKRVHWKGDSKFLSSITAKQAFFASTTKNATGGTLAVSLLADANYGSKIPDTGSVSGEEP